MAKTNGCSLNWGGLDKAVNTAAKKLADRKKLMNSVGDALVSGTLGRFESEESPEGVKWEPSGRAWTEGVQDGGFGKTLANTGRLKQSIDYTTTSDTVMVGSKEEVNAGTILKYAAIHQYGGKAGKGLKVTIPARPFIGVSKADMEEVKATLQAFLEGAFSK